MTAAPLFDNGLAAGGLCVTGSREAMFGDRNSDAPLAERMRPETLDEFVGQESILGPESLLRRSIERDQVSSLILWGPPGCGKTTLARIIATRTRARFVPFSAVLSGIKDVQKVMRGAEENRRAYGQRTILFVDEIHRFNRAQQDAFLPYVERGDIVLIGSTTENPSFQVNSALLSRCRTVILEPLDTRHVEILIRRALSDARGLADAGIELEETRIAALARISQGDARVALNVLEHLASSVAAGPDGIRRPTDNDLAEALQRPSLRYDRAGEEHFNLISALHKSLRSSDPDAAVYWVARMLEAGEEPLYIARRMVRFASEDVGLADPGALSRALASMNAVRFLGLPEGALALVQAAIDLAAAPKSNSVERAYTRAVADVRSGANPPVPLHLRNAATKLMSQAGYGRGYRHAHDEPEGVPAMDCLPAVLSGRRYYEPGDHGHERKMKERLAVIAESRKRARQREKR